MVSFSDLNEDDADDNDDYDFLNDKALVRDDFRSCSEKTFRFSCS